MLSAFYLSALLSIAAVGICKAALATLPAENEFGFSLQEYDDCFKETYHAEPYWNEHFCSMKNFAILKKFQTGPITQVFLVRDSQWHRQAVVKVVSNDYEEVYRLEKCLLKAVSSPLIPQLYCTMHVEPSELFPAGGMAIVMEHLDGRDLTAVTNNEIMARVHKRDRWITKNWHRVFLDVGGFIQSMHRHGLIHRDIKPENIILLYNGGLRVIDFGFSGKVTHLQPVRCTPGYTCPKLLEEMTRHPDGLYDYEPFWTTDFYAFGMTLLVLIEGYMPWDDVEDEYNDGALELASEKILREILKKNGQFGMLLAGFLDSDPSKRCDFNRALAVYNGMRW